VSFRLSLAPIVGSGMLGLTEREKVILGLYYRSVGFCEPPRFFMHMGQRPIVTLS